VKRFLFLLAVLGVLTSCANTMVANNKEYQDYKERVIQLLEQTLSAEIGETYNNEKLIERAIFTHEARRIGGGHSAYSDDMRKTLHTYVIQIEEYNAKINRLFQEHRLAEQFEAERKQQEQYA